MPGRLGSLVRPELPYAELHGRPAPTLPTVASLDLSHALCSPPEGAALLGPASLPAALLVAVCTFAPFASAMGRSTQMKDPQVPGTTPVCLAAPIPAESWAS